MRLLDQLDGMLIDNGNYNSADLYDLLCVFSSFKPKECSRGIWLSVMLTDVLP